MIEQAAGPRMTTNRVGRMNRINGTVMIAGSRAAFSSARIMRSLRNSADEDAQRRGERRSVLLGLNHRGDDAADRVEVDAIGEVFERLAALG